MTAQRCPHCQSSVVFSADGSCPNCRRLRTAAPAAGDPSGQAAEQTNPYASPTAMAEPPRPPVKVKAYGLIPMTQNFYLTLQVVLGIALLGAAIACQDTFAGLGGSFAFINDHYWTIIVVVVALELVETTLMLKKYRKAEEERAKPASAQP